MFFDPYCTGSILKSVRQASQVNLAEMSAMGQKADIGVRPRNVRFTPKSRHSLPRPACPLCAQKQTYAVQQKTLLFDHLVGAREHCPWNGKAKCFGGFQVYGQLVLGRRLYRKLGGFLTLEYAIDVGGRQPELFD